MRTPLWAQPRSSRRREIVGYVAVALLYLAAMAVAIPALRVPPHIDQITIDNPHPWWVSIDVTDRDREAWLGIGGVARDGSYTFRDVIDQGFVWTFEFAYGGERVELTVTRRQLEDAGWRIAVPAELADQLRRVGIPESAP